MSKELLLPKRDKEGKCYLSYSQIKTWKDSKRKYIREYFLKEDTDNVGLQKFGDFGHKVGEAFENNDFSAFEPDEIEFLKTVPKYDEFERKVRLDMDGFHIIGYIDTNTKPEEGRVGKKKVKYIKKIGDYKTGDVEKKGSSKVDYSSDDYLQIEIYAAALEQEFGKAPDQGDVFLIGRSGNAFAGEKLELTKEFIPINRKVTKARLNQVLEEVQAIAEEISAYYEAFLKINKLI